MYTRLHAANGIVGEGVKFERIRRVTGYLVGTLDRFNNAKRAEVRDRVKHMHDILHFTDISKMDYYKKSKLYQEIRLYFFTIKWHNPSRGGVRGHF